MKLSNIFKKESSKNLDSKNSNIQKLDKNQLEKVIGGDGEGTELDSEEARHVSTQGLPTKGKTSK